MLPKYCEEKKKIWRSVDGKMTMFIHKKIHAHVLENIMGLTKI